MCASSISHQIVEEMEREKERDRGSLIDPGNYLIRLTIFLRIGDDIIDNIVSISKFVASIGKLG